MQGRYRAITLGEMTPQEIDRLIGQVAARLKIRLDRNDPAFVLVELNRLVLEQAIKDILQRVKEALASLDRPAGESGRPGGPSAVWLVGLVCGLSLVMSGFLVGYLLGFLRLGR